MREGRGKREGFKGAERWLPWWWGNCICGTFMDKQKIRENLPYSSYLLIIND
jgi:hypothetical protein